MFSVVSSLPWPSYKVLLFKHAGCFVGDLWLPFFGQVWHRVPRGRSFNGISASRDPQGFGTVHPGPQCSCTPCNGRPVCFQGKSGSPSRSRWTPCWKVWHWSQSWRRPWQMPRMRNSVTSQVRGVPDASPRPPKAFDPHLQASLGWFIST